MTSLFWRSELDKLGVAHGTDKSSIEHDYLKFYEFFFSSFRDEEFLCLELGVGPRRNKGKSLLMLRDYFPRAQIVGVDIREDAREIEGDRIHIEIGDCGSRDFLLSLAEKYEPKVIIDDASHLWSHQILSLETLFPALEPGGLFVMEDIHTSFEPMTAEYGDGPKDATTFLCELAHLVVGGRRRHSSYKLSPPTLEMVQLSMTIETIAFHRNTSLLVKKC